MDADPVMVLGEMERRPDESLREEVGLFRGVKCAGVDEASGRTCAEDKECDKRRLRSKGEGEGADMVF